jgi:hypothetical protein
LASVCVLNLADLIALRGKSFKKKDLIKLNRKLRNIAASKADHMGLSWQVLTVPEHPSRLIVCLLPSVNLELLSDEHWELSLNTGMAVVESQTAQAEESANKIE